MEQQINPTRRMHVYTNYEELYERWVRIYLILNKVKLTEQHTKILSSFCLKGINEDCYVYLEAEGIVAAKYVIDAAKTRMKSLGLIEKLKYNKWKVNEKLNIPIGVVFDLQLKLAHK
jgi:hypothetical protein